MVRGSEKPFLLGGFRPFFRGLLLSNFGGISSQTPWVVGPFLLQASETGALLTKGDFSKVTFKNGIMTKARLRDVERNIADCFQKKYIYIYISIILYIVYLFKYIPSWELTCLWRWCSFSSGGIWPFLERIYDCMHHHNTNDPGNNDIDNKHDVYIYICIRDFYICMKTCFDTPNHHYSCYFRVIHAQH